MSTIYDTDPNTHTIAAAWSSSPIGDPATGPTELWETVDHDEAVAPAPKQMSIARHAALVAALAGGIGAGAAFGLAVFEFTDSAQPTVAVPSVSAPVSAPSGDTPGANQAVPPKEAVSAPDNALGPKPVVSAPESAPGANVAPSSQAGLGSADVGSPPAGAPGNTTVIVDIPIPPLPEPSPLPEQPKPEPKPKPQPTLQQKPALDPTLQPAPPQVFTTAPKKPKLTLETTVPPTLGPKVQPTMQVPHKLQWPEP